MSEHESPDNGRGEVRLSPQDASDIKLALLDLRSRVDALVSAVDRNTSAVNAGTATTAPLVDERTRWAKLRSDAWSSLLARPIQWALAVSMAAAFAVAIATGQAAAVFATLTKFQGGNSTVVVTGGSPALTPPSDGGTTTP